MTAVEEKIVDYGPAIGGAKKDLWSGHLTFRDTLSFTPEEKEKYIRKDEIWPKPDYRKMIEEGLSSGLCFFISEMRRLTPTGPMEYTDEAVEKYIEMVTYIRDHAMKVRTNLEAKNLMNDFIWKRYIYPGNKNIYWILSQGEVRKFGYSKDEKSVMRRSEQLQVLRYPDEAEPYVGFHGEPRFAHKVQGDVSYYGLGRFSMDDFKEGHYIVFDNRNAVFITPDLNKASIYVATVMQEYAQLVGGKSEASGTKSKKRFVPRQLRFVERNGPEYLYERYVKVPLEENTEGQMTMNLSDDDEVVHAKPEYFDEVFKAPSLEFGNWETQKDRQAGLDMAFNALMDLSDVLNISPKDISFNGVLKFAFGSRGSGNARAHYEPERQVINLTKPKGAGALAHEWGHALDHYIGKYYRGKESTQLGSENLKGLPEPFKDLIESLKYKTVTEEVDNTESARKEVEACEKNLRLTFVNLRTLVKEKGGEIEAERLDEALDDLMGNLDKVNGLEYIFAKTENEYIEKISEIKKRATGHVLPKDEKKDMVRRCATLRSLKENLEKSGPKTVTHRKKTDYYEGSLEIGEKFARSGGYWESPEEMFARAFDCYIEDKLKELGRTSDYLTYYASDFGNASPRGDERKLFNKKFDELFAFLREEKLLHPKA